MHGGRTAVRLLQGRNGLILKSWLVKSQFVENEVPSSYIMNQVIEAADMSSVRLERLERFPLVAWVRNEEKDSWRLQ